jgi:IclR-like helix-turn-helix domain-containing protein
MLKTTLSTIVVVPELCPVCLGSGLIMGMGGVAVPVWMSTGYSVKCGKCDGKGWLSERSERTSSTELELQNVLEIIKEHSAGLNIDDISRLSGFDIPTVHRALESLRSKGLVGVKGVSPVVFYITKSNA